MEISLTGLETLSKHYHLVCGVPCDTSRGCFCVSGQLQNLLSYKKPENLKHDLSTQRKWFFSSLIS